MGCLLILSIVVVSTARVAICAAPAAKCTKNDPRKTIWPECMRDEDGMVLWCDSSAYTSIPDPATMYKDRSCNDSIELYINDSCLPALRRSEIGKYPEIELFHCGENFIKQIGRGVFTKNTKLRTLILSSNLIHTIHTGAFNGLDKLETLNITNNKIAKLSGDMFSGLSSLKELYLQSNLIQVLHGNVFQRLKALEVLVLTGNRISHIDAKAFVGLLNLRRLHLDGNELTTLDEATFMSTPKLKVLTLSYNTFNIWPTFSKNSLMNLHTLNLGHNLLRDVDIKQTTNLSKLQNLSLENNSIPLISEDAFQQMPSLRFLNLSSNGIEEISQCAFSQSCHLEVLNLSNNTLQTPYPEWFTALIENNAVKGTDISGNQWKCDCEAIRFYDFLSKLSRSWMDVLNIKCDWPKEHVGKNLSDAVYFLKNDPKCASEPYRNIERPCNSSVPLPVRVTTVYTYQPTTTEEETTKNLIKYEKANNEFMIGLIESTTHEDSPIQQNETLFVFLIAALCVTLSLLIVVAICYLKRSKARHNCKDKKPDSMDILVTASHTTNRSESMESNESGKQSSTSTTITICSLDSPYNEETAPFQPIDDIKSNSRTSSDSGISSDLTPSQVGVSLESRSSTSVLNIEDETANTETVPKSVTSNNPSIPRSLNNDYQLIIPVEGRKDPIGGNVCDGTL